MHRKNQQQNGGKTIEQRKPKWTKIKSRTRGRIHQKRGRINLHSSLSFLIYTVPPLGQQHCALLVHHDIQGPAMDKIMLIISTIKVLLIRRKTETQRITG